MTLPFNESQIFTGNKGKVIDDQGMPLQEVQEFNARLNLQHGDIKVVGSVWTGSKLEGMSGTGTMKVYMISTALTRRIAEALASGQEYITQFVGEMGNDAGTVQRVLLQNVKFTNQLDLVKFSAQQTTDQDLEFRFTGFRFL